MKFTKWIVIIFAIYSLNIYAQKSRIYGLVNRENGVTLFGYIDLKTDSVVYLKNHGISGQTGHTIIDFDNKYYIIQQENGINFLDLETGELVHSFPDFLQEFQYDPRTQLFYGIKCPDPNAPVGNYNTFASYNINTGETTLYKTIYGCRGTLGGDVGIIDPINNYYITFTPSWQFPELNRWVAIDIKTGEIVKILSTIPAYANSFKYDSVTKLIYFVYWTGKEEKFASFDVNSLKINDISVLTGVKYIIGECSVDQVNRYYIIKTDIGTLVVDIDSGRIVKNVNCEFYSMKVYFDDTSLSGKLKDVVIDFDNGDIKYPNLIADVSLYKNDSLVAKRKSGLSGNFGFSKLDTGLYNLEISYNNVQNNSSIIKTPVLNNSFSSSFLFGNLTSQYQKTKMVIPNVKHDANVGTLKYPISLFSEKYYLIDRLEKPSFDVQLFGGLYSNPIQIMGYNENLVRNLLDKWSFLTNNNEITNNSLQRLILAEKAVDDYFHDASIMSTEAMKSFYGIGKSIFAANKMLKKFDELTHASGPSGDIRNKILLETMRLSVKVISTLGKRAVTAVCSRINPPELGNKYSTAMNRLIASLECTADPKQFFSEEYLKGIIFQNGSALILQDIYIRQLSQQTINSAEKYSRACSFNGSFSDAYNLSKAWKQKTHSNTLAVKQAAEDLIYWSKLGDQCSELATIASTFMAATGVGAPEAAAVKTFGTIAKGISIFCVSRAIFSTLFQLSNINKELKYNVDGIYHPAGSANFPVSNGFNYKYAIQKKQNTNSYSNKPGNNIQKMQNNNSEYNQTLLSVLNNVNNNKRTNAYTEFQKLLQLDESFSNSADMSMLPIFSVASKIDSTVNNFDSLYFNGSSLLENFLINRSVFYSSFASYMIDSTNQSLRDTVNYYGNQLITANNTMVSSIDQLNQTVENTEKPAIVTALKAEAPKSVLPGSSFNVRIYFQNTGDTSADSLYLKLTISSGFTAQEDSVYVGTLASEASDSVTFHITAPATDSTGYFNIEFISPGTYSQPVSKLLVSNKEDSQLPVEISSFTATAYGNSVKLNWKTATEINNYGFSIERSAANKESWEKIGFVQGHGNSNAVKEYSFTDNNPLPSNIQYRLKQIDNNGKFRYYDALSVALDIPKEYKLMQNSPNPFNPVTAIKFQLPLNSFVTVKVYDMIGKEITTLINEEKPAGSYIIYWNGKDKNGQTVSSGIYLYKLTAGNYSETRKMNFLK